MSQDLLTLSTFPSMEELPPELKESGGQTAAAADLSGWHLYVGVFLPLANPSWYEYHHDVLVRAEAGKSLNETPAE